MSADFNRLQGEILGIGLGVGGALLCAVLACIRIGLSMARDRRSELRANDRNTKADILARSSLSSPKRITALLDLSIADRDPSHFAAPANSVELSSVELVDVLATGTAAQPAQPAAAAARSVAEADPDNSSVELGSVELLDVLAAAPPPQPFAAAAARSAEDPENDRRS